MFSRTAFVMTFGATLALYGCPPKESAPTTATTPTNNAPGSGAPASQPADHPTDHPADHPADHHAGQPTDQPASQPASKPGAALDKGTSPATRDQIDPDGTVRRGVALSSAPAITVDELVKQAAALEKKTVKVTGVVDTVCKVKGCWMVLKGSQDQQLRVTFKDYAYFVPKSAAGMTATVEGEFTLNTLDVETAQHLEDESNQGGAPKKITEPVKELTISAVALELAPAKQS